MSRRESLSSLDYKLNDALFEFENFKKKFLLANKHLTRLNSTLSVKIEELNVQISVLYVENLRLRASEIALTSQLKRERQQSRKTNGGNAAPPTLSSPKARFPPTKATDLISPQFRTARPPNLSVIYEDEGPINLSAGEKGKSTIGETFGSSASKLPIPARESSPTPPEIQAQRIDYSNVNTTIKPEKQIRRPGGLLKPNLESFAPIRSRSPAFGSPIRLETSLEQGEEKSVPVGREKRVRKSLNYAEPRLNTKMRKPDLPPSREPERSSAAGMSTQTTQLQFLRTPSPNSLSSRGSSPSRKSTSSESVEGMNGPKKPVRKRGNNAKRKLNIKMWKPNLGAGRRKRSSAARMSTHGPSSSTDEPQGAIVADRGAAQPPLSSQLTLHLRAANANRIKPVPSPAVHVRGPGSREHLADYDIPDRIKKEEYLLGGKSSLRTVKTIPIVHTVSQAAPEPDLPSPTTFAHADDDIRSQETILQSEARRPLGQTPKYVQGSTEWIFDYGIEYNSEDDSAGVSMDLLVEKMRLHDTSFVLPFVTSAQTHSDNPDNGGVPPSNPQTTNPDTGPTWTLNGSRQSIPTSEFVRDYESNGSSEQIHAQTGACPLFSVQSFEPQVKGLSSDIIVTLGALPEDSTETLFVADIGIPSTPSQSANLDDFSHKIFEHLSSSSCESFETMLSEGLDFRFGNESNRMIDGIWDRQSINSQETFESAHEPPPELLLALGLHLDAIPHLTPLSTIDEFSLDVDSPAPGCTSMSRNEGPSHEEGSANSDNAVTNPKVHSPLSISFIRDVSNVSINRSHINFTTNIMEQVDDVRVGLHTLYSRSDPTALHNSYERQKTINQQMKALRAWGSQLLITSSSTPGEYPLSVPSIKTRDLEEVVKDVFTWLYSASSPQSIMWLYDEDERHDGNLRTSLIGQCLANFLGERHDLTASYFFKKCSPYSHAGILHSGTDGKDTSSSVIPTIAFEITRRFPEVKIPIALTATNDLWIFDLSLDEQMRKLVVEPLQAASNVVKGNSESYRFPQLFLIHGLEDCKDEDFQELFLYAFGKSLTQLQQYIPHKLILLGRHTAHLRECFSKPEMEKIVRYRPLPVSQDVEV